MSKVVKQEQNAVSERTPQLIAVEIRSIDTQTRDFVMRSAIEIGKKLTEAKTLVPHGEWGKWLDSNVSYSQSTANNFMRIADEYAGSNPQAFGNLNYTQAVALLGVPAEKRESFAEENNVTEMSTRELQQAIKDNQELERLLKEEQGRFQAEHLRADEEKKNRESLFEQYQIEMDLRKSQEGQINQLQLDLEAVGNDKASMKLKDDLKAQKVALAESKNRIKELEEALNAKPIDISATVEVIPEETQKELESLRQREQELAEMAKRKDEESAKQLADLQELLRKNNNTATIQVKVLFDQLVGISKDLVSSVTKIENEEQRKAIQGRILQFFDQIKGSL